MTFFSWFDDRTLMACFCMLVTVFSFMLLTLRVLHPRLPGLGSVAAGFSAGSAATILLFLQGQIPLGLALAGGGGLSFFSSILLYRGVLQFCNHQRPVSGAGILPAPEPGALSRTYFAQVSVFNLLCFAVVLWFTIVSPREAVRVVAIAGSMAVTRWLISWKMLQVARGRVHLIALGVTVGVVAFVMTIQAIRGALFASATSHLEPVHLETPSLLFGVLMVCVQGVLYLMMFSSMVTESIHEEAQLDHLTGILNRRGIESALEAEMARTRRTGICFSMLLIDVDHFKTINDRCGHACGDESLRLVAQTVLRTVRIYDRMGRYGGDEFMLLLPQADSAEAMSTASRIVEEVRKLPPRMKGLPMTVSIGVTCSWAQEHSADVMTRADAALYAAKRGGRDCAHLNLGSVAHATASADSMYLPEDARTPAPVLVGDRSLPSEA